MLAKLNDNWGVLTPWRTVNELQTGFWGLLDELGDSVNRRLVSYPRITLDENEDSTVAKFVLPGYKAAEIDVSVVGDFLTVKAERQCEELSDNERYLHRERACGRFEETVKLPSRVKAAEVSAKYADGILTVTLPRQEEEKPMTIKINQ